jgi:hypothetical protein
MKLISLIGQRFGKLTVFGMGETTKSGRMWHCKCDCGGESIVSATNLRTGTSSCINCRGLVDLTGQKFGRWTVLEHAGRAQSDAKKPRHQWKCECECGTQSIVDGWSLTSGNSKSCGCYKRDNPSHLQHGMTGHPAHNAWKHARGRCFSKTDTDYDLYGGRGITMCDRWSDFEMFWQDMKSTWQEGLTLDRIDTNGNYEPGNCRWATMKEQANNRRNNVLIDTPDGRMNVKQASEKYNISETTIHTRIALGWTGSDLLIPPLRR